MDPDLFEVIVVLNGEPDGSRELVTEHAAQHPGVTWRVVELLDRPGVGRARNAGIAVARRTYIALIDDDDTISPNYLAALYAHAAWDVVPMAWLDNVSADGTVDESTHINRILPRFAGQTLGVEEAPDLLSLNACKLLPLPLVRRVGYDTELRSGVDVEFLTRLYAAGRFRMHALRRDEGAVYLRTMRPGSVSRQEYTFEFSVEGRLDVIQRMSPYAMSPHPDVQALARARIAAQGSFMRNYLTATPGRPPTRPRRHRAPPPPVVRAVSLRSIAVRPTRLAISYCFAPTSVRSDRGGEARSARPGVVDVIYNAMDYRARDRQQHQGHRWTLGRTRDGHRSPDLFGAWSRRRRRSASRAGRPSSATEAAKGRYTSVWSRAMWPASHALAALHALRRPGIALGRRSSPTRCPATSRASGAPAPSTIAATSKELLTGLTDAGVAVPDGPHAVRAVRADWPTRWPASSHFNHTLTSSSSC